ncbi:MAG: histidine triad nucleotide-binding protein [Elusimicrobia bacterium]|nr:histidine triad nucleotide-binding protein [Elusimicrobiota bacterium]
MVDCLFCQIVQRKIPATVVFENEHVLAFRDMHPQAPVHVLVIPKPHVSSVSEMTPEKMGLWEKIYQAAQQIAKQEQIDGSGFRLVVNNGPNAGQAVAHLHLHVLGGRRLTWPPG